MQVSAGQLQALPPDEVGPAVLGPVEDQWFDRKSARISAQKLAITELAMANAEGGVIVVGIHNGRVEGTDGDAVHRNNLMQAGVDHSEPPVRIRSELVPCINDRGDLDSLLVVEVGPSPVVHATKRDECYLRIGDEDRRLRFAQRQELIYDKGQSHFDGTTVPGVAVADLDRRLIEDYASELGGSDPERVLQARSLVTPQGEVTSAGYLLFAAHPQEGFPEAYVRVLRFDGIERSTGRRQNLRADVRCEGAATQVIEAADAAVQDLQPTRQALGPKGRFERQALIPRDAWLEGIVNAVIHRSYSLGGDHIRVEIYDNRIEISSPGRFPGIVGLEDPRRAPRYARNPRIARVCADYRFGQELGEGIKRIFDEMRTAGLIDPVYRQTPTSVTLTLAATPLDPEVAARLPSRAREVMEHIRESGGLSTGDIAELIDLSKPATLRRLNALQDAGLIEWVGKAKKDPRAFWRLRSD